MDLNEFLELKARLRGELIPTELAKVARQAGKSSEALIQWFNLKRFSAMDDENMDALTEVIENRKARLLERTQRAQSAMAA